MNLRHPFDDYFRMSESASQPVSDRPQRSYGMKFCIRCNTDRPSLGSKKVGEGMWSCALHRKPSADLSILAPRMLNPEGEA